MLISEHACVRQKCGRIQMLTSGELGCRVRSTCSSDKRTCHSELWGRDKC